MPAKKRVVKKAAASKMAPALDGVFERLKKVLEPYAKHMVVKHDGQGIYYLESAPVPKYGTEVFFGAVQAGKTQVNFHFMPIYVFPELRDTLSPALKKRLRGTSKFTFVELDAPLLRELTALVRKGYQGYKRGGVFAA
jgi:hypothetical protein